MQFVLYFLFEEDEKKKICSLKYLWFTGSHVYATATYIYIYWVSKNEIMFNHDRHSTLYEMGIIFDEIFVPLLKLNYTCKSIKQHREMSLCWKRVEKIYFICFPFLQSCSFITTSWFDFFSIQMRIIL